MSFATIPAFAMCDCARAHEGTNCATSPFDWLAELPDTVDGAVVFNNPAEQFLFSDSNESMRQMIAMSGMLFDTHEAFDSLIHAFGDDTQETMRALFSQHVVVTWDSKGLKEDEQRSIFNPGLNMSWTIVCEVEPGHVEQLRAGLNPMRRSIEHGQTIWAIEKGRYNVLLLNEKAGGFKSMVVLSPKKSMGLFKEVLSAYFSKPSLHRSLLNDRDQVLESIPDVDGQWAAAWFMHLGGSNDVEGDDKKESVFAGILSPTGEGMEVDFATDYQLGLPETDAPVGLLSAVGDEEVAAIAMAAMPGFEIQDQSLSASFSFLNNKDSIQQAESSTDILTGGPGLLLLEELTNPTSGTDLMQHSLAMTLYAQFADLSAGKTVSLASRVDRVMHDLVEAFDPSRPPIYQGKFPHAIRTHHVNYEQPQVVDSDEESDEEQEQIGVSAWPGSNPKLSWISTNSSRSEGLIASFAPSWANSAKRVGLMQTAFRAVESLAQASGHSGIITAGYVQPNRLFELMDSDSDMNLMLLGAFDRIRWKVSRTSFGLRGHVGIRFTCNPNVQSLGEKASESE